MGSWVLKKGKKRASTGTGEENKRGKGCYAISFLVLAMSLLYYS